MSSPYVEKVLMNRHIVRLCAVPVLALACTSETPAETPQPSTGGATAGGAGGTTGGAGAGGAGGTNAGGQNAAGGSAGSGGAAGSSGGAGGAAGNSSGAGGVAGSSGGSGGSAGSGEISDITDALVGLRVDAPCAGTPDTTVGAVCNHVMLTENGGFSSSKEVTIAGTPGTTYDVVLRIRGIVEPTNIAGGERPDTSTLEYMNMSFRKVPYTIGGTVVAEDADYAQWSIAVTSPAQRYYLNDYQKVGHYIFELDYEITVPMEAGTTVILNGTDENEREIVNYEQYTPDGIAGSMNLGQFVQVDVVAVTPR
jgi:hypothetical protein